MAELAFEVLALALEATRGTPVTPPTHYLPVTGNINPQQSRYRPSEARGTLAANHRSIVVRRGAEWSVEGGLDPNYAPLLFNMAVQGGVTAPSTPGGATTARLWTFAPSMLTDNLASATLYSGDPGTQVWQAPYAMADSLEISADASSEDGVTWSLGGRAHFPARVAAPTLPAQNIGALLVPGRMQVWLDTSSAIGTTELTGRVVSANFSVNNNLAYKHFANGPTGHLGFQRVGRARRHAESTIVLDLTDTAQYELWEAGGLVKMRVRLNGPLIEAGFYFYVEWDIYGPFDSFAWGELEGTNRTIELTVVSEYNSVAGHDFALRVQNTRSAL